MFNFSKKKSTNDTALLSKTASLLIHAAKIDENYTNKEHEIIYLRYDDIGMKYVYLCTSCDHSWKP